MKFVCDKCKTRYSIGEDRVRGKILKIRCKNCANVITVREGMDEAGAADDGRGKPITAAPAPIPPAELEQEWYVSIDGVQSGPYSLADAQKWIASKPFEAELYCWSEGFDDWLAVDKVSHFRNLRKPKAPAPSARPKTIPPPVPSREEQTPLFAATMAAIEKDAASSGHVPVSAPASAKPATVRVNGAGSGAMPAIPSRPASPSGRFNAQKGPGHAALAAAFDTGDGVDSRAQSEPGFDARPAPAPKADAAPARTVKAALDDDDDLSIGEVSRVVKLADLAPKPRAPTAAGTGQTGSQPALVGGATGAVPRIGVGTASFPRYAATGAQPKLSPTELGMNVDPSFLAQGPAPDESMVAQSFAQRHRRGMIALLSFAGLLLAGVIGVVVYITSGQTEEVGRGLGGTRTIDTSRPEDLVRRQLPPTETGSAAPTVTQRPRWTPRPNTGTTTTPQVEDDPKGLSLRASEIEDMAAKQGEGTKRCYMRAQKGAIGFEIAELKKISVTLTIGKDGVVSKVELSEHANDSFGQCLIARIKGWRFRESPSGGTFRISLAFSS